MGKRNMILRILLVFTLFLPLFLFTAAKTKAESVLERVKTRGKLIAGVRYDFEPMGYKDEKGRVVGFDVEIMKYFAEKMKVELELQPVTAQNRIYMLSTDRVDIVAAGMTHQKKRDRLIDFSITYFMSGQTLLVKKGSGIKSYHDLADKVVTVVQGTTGERNIKQVQPKAKLLTFKLYPQALLALKLGKAIALTTDNTYCITQARKNPELEVVGGLFSQEPYGLGVRENDSKWRDWVNFTLQEMWKDGSYKRIFRKIFGTNPDFQIEVWPD
ncbi:MAG: transporter substrate-binding domain-containing protein [Thermodesulfobacteriota bacterium]